jgi:hypothetical protein
MFRRRTIVGARCSSTTFPVVDHRFLVQPANLPIAANLVVERWRRSSRLCRGDDGHRSGRLRSTGFIRETLIAARTIGLGGCGGHLRSRSGGRRIATGRRTTAGRLTDATTGSTTGKRVVGRQTHSHNNQRGDKNGLRHGALPFEQRPCLRPHQESLNKAGIENKHIPPISICVSNAMDPVGPPLRDCQMLDLDPQFPPCPLPHKAMVRELREQSPFYKFRLSTPCPKKRKRGERTRGIVQGPTV